MIAKIFVTASFAAALMAGSALAQENSNNDVLVPKKNQSQGANDQGGNQQPDASANRKKKPVSGDNAESGAGQQEEGKQQNAQGNQDEKPEGSGASQNQAEGGEKLKKNSADAKDDKATGSVSKADQDPVERTRVIREKIVTKNVTRIDRSRIDFDINVGIAVPRTIVLNPLPIEVYEVVPDYRGYSYFVLSDGTIVIVNPGSLQIVYVLAG